MRSTAFQIFFLLNRIDHGNKYTNLARGLHSSPPGILPWSCTWRAGSSPLRVFSVRSCFQCCRVRKWKHLQPIPCRDWPLKPFSLSLPLPLSLSFSVTVCVYLCTCCCWCGWCKFDEEEHQCFMTCLFSLACVTNIIITANVSISVLFSSSFFSPPWTLWKHGQSSAGVVARQFQPRKYLQFPCEN